MVDLRYNCNKHFDICYNLYPRIPNMEHIFDTWFPEVDLSWCCWADFLQQNLNIFMVFEFQSKASLIIVPVQDLNSVMSVDVSLEYCLYWCFLVFVFIYWCWGQIYVGTNCYHPVFLTDHISVFSAPLETAVT